MAKICLLIVASAPQILTGAVGAQSAWNQVRAEAFTWMSRPVLSFIQHMELPLPDLLEKCLPGTPGQQRAGSQGVSATVCLRLARAVLSALQQFPPLRGRLHRRPLYLMLQHQVGFLPS